MDWIPLFFDNKFAQFDGYKQISEHVMAVGTVSESLVPDGCVWVDIAQGSAGDGTGRDCCSLLYCTGRCCIRDGTEDGAQGGSE